MKKGFALSGGRRLARALLVGVAVVVVLAPGSVASAEPSPSQIEQEIETASNQLEDVVEAYNKVTEDLKATQAAAADLAARMQPLQTGLDAAYANVHELAAAAYKGQSGLRTISVLLSAGSTGAFVDQLTDLDQISRSQQRDISGYKQAKGQFDAEKDRLDKLLAQQTAQKAELQARTDKIEADITKLEALQRKAAAAGVKTPAPTNAGPPPPVSGAAGIAVRFAYAQLGKPYRWGAAGPSSYDCSGITMAAWAAAGVRLPHNAAMQWNTVRHVSRSALAPGDLVFYRGLGHMGMYVGNGTIIHAPHTGDVVRLAGIDRSPPYGYARPG